MRSTSYCPDCKTTRSSDYCPSCGAETRERTSENIDWPITFTYEFTVVEDSLDIEPKIRKQLDHTQVLPDGFGDPHGGYYAKYFEASEKYEVTIYEDGTYDVEVYEDERECPACNHRLRRDDDGGRRLCKNDRCRVDTCILAGNV